MISAKRSCQRMIVLIDADNVEIEEGHPGRLWIDYGKLLHQMNEREIVRAIYYRPTRTLTDGAVRAVTRAGVEIKDTFKNSDAWFITDAIAFARKYDVIAFVGGDGDLEPVIPMLRALGTGVVVWSWEDCVSPRVKELVDEFVALDGRDLIIPRNDGARTWGGARSSAGSGRSPAIDPSTVVDSAAG
ncbi:MAG: NYN domain-containing protein [Pirellulaceae bacterium]